MRLGSTGPRVRQLEQKLKASGDLKGPVDNRFDAKTAKAVVAWKRENGWDAPKAVVGARMADELGIKGAFTAAEPEGSKTPSKMKGATYNCEIGRNPQVVKKTVADFAKKGDLDFMQLQEISGYHKELRSIPGYRLITFPGSKDHGETGVLVKKELLAQYPKSIEAATGWTNVHGGPAQPRASTSVKLAGWLRVASIHAPPGIDWKNGHAVGGSDRVKSYQSLTARLAAHANRVQSRGVAVLFGGDWNEGARTGGPGSPSWLAAQAGLKKHATGGIDWEMSSGCKVSNVKVGANGGSDHRIVTFTVSR